MISVGTGLDRCLTSLKGSIHTQLVKSGDLRFLMLWLKSGTVVRQVVAVRLRRV